MLQHPRECPVCGHNDTKRLFRPKHSPGIVARCQRCDLVYVPVVENNRALIAEGPVLGEFNPNILTSTNLQNVANCWEFAQLPDKSSEQPALQRNAVDALARIECYQQPFGSLLDFGCGWGFFLGTAKERGWAPYGLEPLPGHAVHARSEFGATVVTDTLRDDTFSSEFFDVITAFQVFEHLPDPAGDLARLRRMLKPGGLILIEVPNIDTWSVRLLGSRHRHFVQDHLNFFSSDTLRALLEKQGFEMLEAYYPTRRMTVRHLVAGWGGRYLPAGVINIAETVLTRLNLWQRLIGLNLGDIVAVIGRKI